jgi:hypothetical protein
VIVFSDSQETEMRTAVRAFLSRISFAHSQNSNDVIEVQTRIEH